MRFKEKMSKKTIYIILIVAIVLITIGWLIWYFILRKETVITPTSIVNFTVPSQTKNGNKLRVISEGRVMSLRQEREKIVFYDFSGQLWQFNQDESKPVLLNETPIQNLAEITWPKVFSPDGKKIVYQKNNSLFTSDSNGKNQRTLISDLKLKDIILKWPNTDNIAIVSKPSSAAVGGLWFLDARNLSIRKIIDNLGLEVLFSPDGKSFIYSYTDQNGQNLKLAFYDKNRNQKNINNVSTLVDKCVWSKNNIDIYCAVPKSWPDFAILPDDYYKNAFLTNDDIWKINTETGEKTLVFEYIGDISNLVLSEDENNIFFISKENQFLYKLIVK